jgi:hypothetical protein
MIDDSPDPIGYEQPNDQHRRGAQKGAQRHAEGSQGPQARERLREQLQSGGSGGHGDERGRHEGEGRHRLFERREQHDEAELNSEKNRLDRDIREHDHNRENFQVRGGAESHRVEPRSHIDPAHPDAPSSGQPPPPEPQRLPRT